MASRKRTVASHGPKAQGLLKSTLGASRDCGVWGGAHAGVPDHKYRRLGWASHREQNREQKDGKAVLLLTEEGRLKAWIWGPWEVSDRVAQVTEGLLRGT